MRHRVIRHPLAEWVDPAVAFSALYSDADLAFWLDSGIDAVGGCSYLGAAVRAVVASVDTGALELFPDGVAVPGNIFEFLGAEQAEGVDIGSSELSAAGGFQLGWVGWFGYELRSKTMPRFADVRRSRYPEAAWLEAARALEFDHAAGTVTLLALGDDWSGETGVWRDAVVATLAAAADAEPAVTEPSGRELAGNPAAIGPTSSMDAEVGVHARWGTTDEEYLAQIRECQAAIESGDAYQLCLTTEVTLDVHPDPLATYLALRSLSPAHHGGLLRVGEFSLLSSSPEQFLSISPDGVIETRPIKGTRRRGDTPEEDARLRAELDASDKERAENLMIVDLMRNDVARVSVVGSVSVPSLLAIESYAQVHQLVSTVRGQLEPGLRPVDAVVACFPAGSMTGAPKLSATGILDRLEQRARGIYSGAFGYFGFDGAIDLAMVIRSIVLDRAGATVGAGGGITALSVPEEELEEVKLKAAVLLRVLGAPETGTARQ